MDFASGRNFGPSRATILEGIDRYGSISAAARAIGMTYRQVWATVKAINEMLPSPAVLTRSDEPPNGAVLTPLGKELVRLYREMENETKRSVTPYLASFEKLFEEEPPPGDCTPRWAALLQPDADNLAFRKGKPRSRNTLDT
jgi:molybdate transport system regulatory protein